MTDLTPALNTLLSAKNVPSIPATANHSPADEFLKEAHRIVRPIHPPLHTPSKSKLTPETSVHLELTHSLTPQISNLDPTRIPLNKHSPQPNPNPSTTIPISKPSTPNRPRTRLHRLLNNNPPPRPSILNKEPLRRRNPPSKNFLATPKQEIRSQRRRRSTSSMGRW